MSFNKQSSKRIADVVRRVERTPINEIGVKASRRSTPQSKITKIVKLVLQDADNPQSLVEVKELLIKITRDGNEITDQDEFQLGDDVSLVEDGESFLAVNPRRNLLSDRVHYLVYKHGKHWVIDNQAVFQSWSQTNGLL